jgi:hypothetical protein
MSRIWKLLTQQSRKKKDRRKKLAVIKGQLHRIKRPAK